MPISDPPPSPKDKYQQLYQLLKEEHHQTLEELRQVRAIIEDYDLELRKRTEELHQANQHNGYLQNVSQRLGSKDFISDKLERSSGT